MARRFQFRGERDGVTFVDDYAHLPSDVDAMIRAAREGGWERVVAVFQPHRYTRTAALWRDFADAFAGADALVLTDVYAAGEQPQPGVSGRLVLRAVLDAHPEQAVTYLPRRADLVAHVPAPRPSRRRRAHARRRRPHHRPRRVAGAVAREPRRPRRRGSPAPGVPRRA